MSQSELESSMDQLRTKIRESQAAKEKELKLREHQKKEDLEKLKANLADLIEQKILRAREKLNAEIQDAHEEFQRDIQEFNESLVDTINSEMTYEPKRSKNFLSQKVFESRASLFSKMMGIQEFATLYNMCLSFMINALLGVVASTWVEKGMILDMDLFSEAFRGGNTVLLMIAVISGWSFLIVPFVQQIYHCNLSIFVYFPIYILVQLLPLLTANAAIIHYDLGILASVVVGIESWRVFMKMHSYLREKLLFGRQNPLATYMPPYMAQVKVKDLHIPEITIEDMQTEIQRYAYFLFAPTLIYRDRYPSLNRGMSAQKMFLLSFNAVGSLLYAFIIFSNFSIPEFRDSFSHKFDMGSVLVCLFRSMVPGTMVLLVIFFGVHHVWFNFWAELLSFGDRKFYEDWWNSTSFLEYYRKWNCLVYDWVYYYLYQDAVRFSQGKIPRALAYLFTFLGTFIMYESIISISFQFFYPIVFITFGGPAVFFIILKSKSSGMNFLFWIMILSANGAIMMFFSWEFYARQAIDLTPEYGWASYFVPHSFMLDNVRIKG